MGMTPTSTAASCWRGGRRTWLSCVRCRSKQRLLRSRHPHCRGWSSSCEASEHKGCRLIGRYEAADRLPSHHHCGDGVRKSPCDDAKGSASSNWWLQGINGWQRRGRRWRGFWNLTTSTQGSGEGCPFGREHPQQLVRNQSRALGGPSQSSNDAIFAIKSQTLNQLWEHKRNSPRRMSCQSARSTTSNGTHTAGYCRACRCRSKSCTHPHAKDVRERLSRPTRCHPLHALACMQPSDMLQRECLRRKTQLSIRNKRRIALAEGTDDTGSLGLSSRG